MKKNKNFYIDSEKSSGNVFADLGLPNPEERLAKAELALQINRLIKQKKLTQVKVAKLLDIDQPKVSLLAQGKLSGFSIERLFKFLNLLGQEIVIKVSEAKTTERANVVVNLPKIKKSSIIKKPTSSLYTPAAVHAKKKK